MNSVLVYSVAEPEVEEWLRSLTIAVPDGPCHRPTRADVHAAVDAAIVRIPWAKVTRCPAQAGGQEAILFEGRSLFGSIWFTPPEAEGQPIRLSFERYPPEIMVPVVEELAGRCGALALFAGYGERPFLVIPGADIYDSIRATLF